MESSKYDNVIEISEWDIYSILADHFGVSIDDIDINVITDVEGQHYLEGKVGINEPEREIFTHQHY